MLDLTVFGHGLVFGLTAGISPGPLLALVISETVRGGFQAGLRVALAPLITDLPIILVTLLILNRVSRSAPILGVITLAGAVFIGFLAYECFQTASTKQKPEQSSGSTGSLVKGIISNLLNPHPYLFWLTIGGPILLAPGKNHVIAGILFLLPFYTCLVGTKIIIAALASHSRFEPSMPAYRIVNTILGGMLIFFALYFLHNGLHYLGVM
ncbi:MAG: LysE family translocator [Deltaproteobacteria bacterium]|nr:MAG: LysE family translocator [Deltaproteobacteria bacterium]